MTRPVAILLYLAVCHVAQATWQAADTLIFKGIENRIAVHPLEQWKGLQDFRFYPTGSGDARGYQCTWEVRDSRLYLVGIEGAVKGKDDKWEQLTLAHLFSDEIKDGRVNADWFSGTLYAPGRRWGERLSDAVRKEQLAKATLVLEVKKGQISIVRYETPMHWAAQYGHVGVIQTLLAHGEDINARDRNDRTPLHWAAASGHESVVKMLLENGADRAARDKDSLSPSDLATHAEHKEAIELLKPGSGSGQQPRNEDSEQDGAGQPATRSESDSEGGDKPQPESEERSR